MKYGFAVALFTAAQAAESFWGSSHSPAYSPYSSSRRTTTYTQHQPAQMTTYTQYQPAQTTTYQRSYSAPAPAYQQSSYQKSYSYGAPAAPQYAPKPQYHAPRPQPEQQYTNGAMFYNILDQLEREQRLHEAAIQNLRLNVQAKEAAA